MSALCYMRLGVSDESVDSVSEFEAVESDDDMSVKLAGSIAIDKRHINTTYMLILAAAFLALVVLLRK